MRTDASAWVCSSALSVYAAASKHEGSTASSNVLSKAALRLLWAAYVFIQSTWSQLRTQWCGAGAASGPGAVHSSHERPSASGGDRYEAGFNGVEAPSVDFGRISLLRRATVKPSASTTASDDVIHLLMSSGVRTGHYFAPRGRRGPPLDATVASSRGM